MPAKKKTTKKQVTKQELPKVDLNKPLHLDTTDRDEREAYAAHLALLKTQPAWKIIEKVLEDNIQILANQIVEKKNEYGEPVDERTVDELRIQHAQLKQMKQLPDELISMFKRPEAALDTQYDPYSGTGLQANVLSMSDTT